MTKAAVYGENHCGLGLVKDFTEGVNEILIFMYTVTVMCYYYHYVIFLVFGRVTFRGRVFVRKKMAFQIIQ